MSSRNQYCPNCENTYSNKHSLCPECEGELKTLNPSQNSIDQSGDGNTALIIGDGNSGPIILPNQEPKQPDNTTYIQREKITPINITTNKPIKAFKVELFAVLNVLGSIASLIGLIKIDSLTTGFPFLFFALPFTMGMMLLSFSLMVRQGKYFHTWIGTLEIDKYKQLYRSKITGTCGHCKHPVKLVTRGPKEARQTILECTEYPLEHRCTFDPSRLGDVGEDYLRQQAQQSQEPTFQ